MNRDEQPFVANAPLSPVEATRYFDLQDLGWEFHRLFAYDEPNDRSIVIVGAAYLDRVLAETLRNFLVDDEKEVARLLEPDGALSTFGARISACYCLGLIGETIKSDLRLVAKIRNRFAHDIRVDFSDPRVEAWCKALRWHRYSMFHDPPSDATTRDFFQVGVNQLVGFLNGLVLVARAEKRTICKHGVAT